MSALAEQWEGLESPARPSAAERRSTQPKSQPAPTIERSEGAAAPEQHATGSSWNVLATELVSYPPRAQEIWLERSFRLERPESSEHASRWLDEELDRLRQRRLNVDTSWSAFDDTATAPTNRVGRPGRLEQSTAPCVHTTPSVRRARAAANAASPRTGAALLGPRGLRRLLPGAATLAALVGIWFGVGALATEAHQTAVHTLPGSVPVHGGLAYVVHPGDTLWGIAERVDGAGVDPRPLVDELQSQLHGKTLQPGDTLVLPR